jgi:hypothetical protein
MIFIGANVVIWPMKYGGRKLALHVFRISKKRRLAYSTKRQVNSP